jgi:hypothetical protein
VTLTTGEMPPARPLRARTLAIAVAASALFAVFVTWPQARAMGTTIAVHDDPLFSIWRISWIAHALTTAPRHLLDGNIFYPATDTLTFSDATLLEALLGAPLLWARVSPTAMYNLLLLGGIAACGVGMFVLARDLVGSTGPALVSAAIFTMAPYRIEHFMHLELQWAMWVPLTFWALTRSIERGSRAAGVLSGVFLFLQIVSCVYYGVFLAITSAALVAVLALSAPRRFVAALPALALGAFVAAVLTAPYLWAYVRTARMLGPRDLVEVTRYSADWRAYLTAPPQNWLWGWTASRWGRAELNLYPGVFAAALAVIGLTHKPRHLVVAFAVVLLIAFDLSRGTHGIVYPMLAPFGLQGLRSPSRSAIVLCCALAMLAGFGVREIQRMVGGKLAACIVVACAVALVTIDDANKGMFLTVAENPGNATVYRLMRSAGRGVVVELPMPVPERLPGREAQIEYWSTAHWFPLVNGYSGYYTGDYIRTIMVMRSFPDDESLDRLKALDVRYIVVHRALYPSNEQYVSLMVKMGGRNDLRWYGTYRDPIGNADLFVIE